MAEGLRIEDLYGELVDAKLIHPQQTERAGEPMLLLSIEVDGKQFKIGVITRRAIDSVLAHGEKRDDGIYLKIPRIALNESGIGWLNFPY